MLTRFKKHPHLSYFFIYSASYLGYGTLITGLGPLIPYLSAETGIVETEYSFVFSCRSFGMVSGAIILKYLQSRPGFLTHHQIIALGSILILITSVLFSQSRSQTMLGLWMYCSGLFYSILQIIVNVCSLMINPSDEMEFWLMLVHGVFGVGGLIGPFLVYIFQTNSYIVLGILLSLVVPFYLLKSSPQVSGYAQGGQHETVKGKPVPRTIQFLLAFIMFMYIGLECTFSGWISSYAVLAGVSDKSAATIYPTVFWIFMTMFRFGLAFVPGTSSKKMRLLIQGNIIAGIISLILIYMGYVKFTCYLSGMMFGVSMSSIFPLVFSINNEFGMSLEDYQTGNIVTCGVVAEGVITMFVGMLMEWIHINMLFYSLIIIAAVMWIDRYICISIYTKDEKKGDNMIELLDKTRTVD